jgi:hypothetical protein
MEDEVLGTEYEEWLDEVESTLEPINEEELWKELNFCNKFMLALQD